MLSQSQQQNSIKHRDYIFATIRLHLCWSSEIVCLLSRFSLLYNYLIGLKIAILSVHMEYNITHSLMSDLSWAADNIHFHKEPITQENQLMIML